MAAGFLFLGVGAIYGANELVTDDEHDDRPVQTAEVAQPPPTLHRAPKGFLTPRPAKAAAGAAAKPAPEHSLREAAEPTEPTIVMAPSKIDKETRRRVEAMNNDLNYPTLEEAAAAAAAANAAEAAASGKYGPPAPPAAVAGAKKPQPAKPAEKAVALTTKPAEKAPAAAKGAAKKERTVVRYVTAEALNVRSAPRPDAPMVARVMKGSMFTVTVVDGAEWAKISTGQYVLAKYLDAAKPGVKRRLATRK